MSYQPSLTSSFNDTHNRSRRLSPQSGMCSFCTEECPGTCEVALSAVLGARSVYPTNTGNNQVASEKDYPIDYSHFNINGRVFGAQGLDEGAETAIFNVKLERSYGRFHKVKTALPVMLPALIKLNWEDYFAGAAMAGVCCVVGEGAWEKDPEIVLENGKIKEFPMMDRILDSFNRYDRGYGQIIVQCNTEDNEVGVAEYALSHGAKAIEFKFGQSAKGTQPVNRLKDIQEALRKQERGGLVHPDPSDPEIQKAWEEGVCPAFYSYGRLPVWTEDYLCQRANELRELGAQNLYFKMGGYDPTDLEKVLRLAVKADIDMVTFDGAGGGSGYSPCKMMNEWALPTVCMESALVDIMKKLREEGAVLPAITLTGGFATEDQVFKALAMGEGEILNIGLCRSSMAAAMSGKAIGKAIREGNVPANLQKYGNTVEEIFSDLPDLRALYGKEANNFSTGAIGVFSYLNRIAFGLQHFGALNRKFDIDLWDKTDLIPLTRDAKELLMGTWFDWK